MGGDSRKGPSPLSSPLNPPTPPPPSPPPQNMQKLIPTASISSTHPIHPPTHPPTNPIQTEDEGMGGAIRKVPFEAYEAIKYEEGVEEYSSEEEESESESEEEEEEEEEWVGKGRVIRDSERRERYYATGAGEEGVEGR